MIANTSIGSLGGKTEWLIWCAAMMSCIAGVLFLFKFTSDPTRSGDLMMLLIAGLFIASLVKSFRDISFLDRETKLASHQVDQLQQVNDIAQFLQSAQPSVFRVHIHSLHSIFLSHSEISQDKVLDIAHARLIARNRVVDLLASILITLGLIGTILGLLIAVGGLGGVLSGDSESSDMGELLASMKTTIDGLGTAFYTTLFGAAAGGVVLRILTSIVDAHIMRYVAHLSELVEVHVLPAMRRTASKLEAQGYYDRL